MKKAVIIILAVLLALPAFAQVGRYKNIKTWYPGYSLKFDTATGELSAIHYDNNEEMTFEAVISPKLSHNSHQTGRYEFRRTRHIGTYQIFDTSSGEYTTVKWIPKDSEGNNITVDVDSLINSAGEGLKNLLKLMEEGLEKARESIPDTLTKA